MLPRPKIQMNAPYWVTQNLIWNLNIKDREAQQFCLKQEEEARRPIYSLTPHSALAPEAFPLTQDHPEAQSKNHRARSSVQSLRSCNFVI